MDEASTYRSTNDELEDMVRLIKESKLRLQVRGAEAAAGRVWPSRRPISDCLSLAWCQDRLRDVTEENKKLLAERPDTYLMVVASAKKVRRHRAAASGSD